MERDFIDNFKVYGNTVAKFRFVSLNEPRGFPICCAVFTTIIATFVMKRAGKLTKCGMFPWQLQNIELESKMKRDLQITVGTKETVGRESEINRRDLI